MPNCKNCNQLFEITKDHLAFYDRVSPIFAGEKFLIPPPTFCPDCRYQRRLTYRNEKKFYKRKCDLTGIDTIAIYSPENEHKIYDQKEWWSDKWSPLSFGRDFDFSRSFFDQFFELKLQVPRPSLTNHNSINSEYTNQAEDNKNCYYLTSSGKNEDSFYSHWLQQCGQCMDCLLTEKSEICYECLNIFKCYNCRYLQNCSGCTDCILAYDCKGCNSCLGCFGLRNQKYCVLNQEVGEEKFKKTWREITENKNKFEEFRKQFEGKMEKFPRKYYVGFNIDNSTGDYLQDAKNAKFCFNCRDICDVSFAYDAWQEELGMDLTETLDDSGFYEVQGCGWGQGTAFCSQNWYCHSLYYCDLMFSDSDCFGCVGLDQKKYCILNKQYEKDDYEKMVAKIIKHMQGTGEWGEFFPAQRSHFCYNESVAQEYFPLTKEQALAKNYRWRDEDPRQYLKQIYQVPEKLAGVPDAIIREVLACVNCGKNFKIVRQELEYYKKHRIFIPGQCPDCRRAARMALRNPRKLWMRKCDKCQKPLESTYSPDRPEKVYCEECYQREIY